MNDSEFWTLAALGPGLAAGCVLAMVALVLFWVLGKGLKVWALISSKLEGNRLLKEAAEIQARDRIDLLEKLAEIDAEILDLYDERADVVQWLGKLQEKGRA